MREPWALDDEHEAVTQQRHENQIGRLQECNKAYLDKIEEQRFIMSRLAADKADSDNRYHNLLMTLSELTGAVTYAMDFIEGAESELWDLVGDDGLRDLRENIFVIERIE